MDPPPSGVNRRNKCLLGPVSTYGEAKANAEKAILHVVRRAKKGGIQKVQARIFRFFNVIGADLEGRFGENPREDLSVYSRLWTSCRDVALGTRTHVIIDGGTLQTVDGTPERDFIHVSDIVEAMHRTLEIDFNLTIKK